MIRRNVGLRVPELDFLAQLSGTARDFQRASDLCKRFVRLADELGDDPANELRDREILDAVAEAAIMRYARPFAGGKRASSELMSLLDAAIANAPTEIQTSHQLFKDLRDLYYAHSINTYEEDVVSVSVRGEPPSTEIEGIGVAHQDVYSFVGTKEIERLDQVSVYMSKALAPAMLAEKERALAFVKKTYPANELGAMDLLAFSPVNFDEPGLERPRERDAIRQKIFDRLGRSS